MITIKQILEAPIGQKFGGIELPVKTTKKIGEVKGNFIHSVVLTDETGDILADVNVDKKYIPLTRGSLIRIIVAEVQAGVPGQLKASESGKKLYIDQWSHPPGITADEHLSEEEIALAEWKERNEKTVRSKIKCLAMVAKIKTEVPIEEVLEFVKHPLLAEIIDEVVKG